MGSSRRKEEGGKGWRESNGKAGKRNEEKKEGEH